MASELPMGYLVSELIKYTDEFLLKEGTEFLKLSNTLAVVKIQDPLVIVNKLKGKFSTTIVASEDHRLHNMAHHINAYIIRILSMLDETFIYDTQDTAYNQHRVFYKTKKESDHRSFRSDPFR